MKAHLSVYGTSSLGPTFGEVVHASTSGQPLRRIRGPDLCKREGELDL